jgi:hypothetical protein
MFSTQYSKTNLFRSISSVLSSFFLTFYVWPRMFYRSGWLRCVLV